MSDLDNKLGLTNTAMYAMIGSVAGPWGAALGGGIGLVQDFAAAGGNAADQIDALTAKVAAAGSLSGEDRYEFQVAGSSLVKDRESLAASERLNTALDRNKSATEDAAFAEAGLASAMDGASQSSREQTFALLENIAAHNKRADEMLAESNAEIALEQAFDDATATIERNGRTLDINTEKGRENQAALNTIAERWNAMTPAAQSAEGALERTREMYVKNAIAAGKGAEDAERLAKALFDLPPVVPIDVTARGAAKTKADIDAIKASLDQIKSKDIVIRAFQETYGKEAGGSRERGTATEGRADGGYISGPGGPRDDLIPALLSNGEYVINAAATQANLPLLHAINSGGRVQRFAAGGHVSGTTPHPSAPSLPAGAQFRLVGADLIELVDSRAAIAISQNHDYRSRR